MEDDDEHEVVCRICRMPAEDDSPLYHPCKCSGSIRHVHATCLSRWLEHSRHDSCELCHHKFQFKPMFAENAPPHLPWEDLFEGLAQRMRVFIIGAARVMFVVSLWMVIVPLVTIIMWRLAFARNLEQGCQALFAPFRSPLGFLADTIQGAFISLTLGCGLLLVTSAWDYFRQHVEMLGGDLAPQPAVAGQPAMVDAAGAGEPQAGGDDVDEVGGAGAVEPQAGGDDVDDVPPPLIEDVDATDSESEDDAVSSPGVWVESDSSDEGDIVPRLGPSGLGGADAGREGGMGQASRTHAAPDREITPVPQDAVGGIDGALFTAAGNSWRASAVKAGWGRVSVDRATGQWVDRVEDGSRLSAEQARLVAGFGAWDGTSGGGGESSGAQPTPGRGARRGAAQPPPGAQPQLAGAPAPAPPLQRRRLPSRGMWGMQNPEYSDDPLYPPSWLVPPRVGPGPAPPPANGNGVLMPAPPGAALPIPRYFPCEAARAGAASGSMGGRHDDGAGPSSSGGTGGGHSGGVQVARTTLSSSGGNSPGSDVEERGPTLPPPPPRYTFEAGEGSGAAGGARAAPRDPARARRPLGLRHRRVRVPAPAPHGVAAARGGAAGDDAPAAAPVAAPAAAPARRAPQPAAAAAQQGAMRHLLQSLVTVLLMSFLFIVGALFIPFNMGRATVTILTRILPMWGPDSPHPFLLALLHASAPSRNGSTSGASSGQAAVLLPGVPSNGTADDSVAMSFAQAHMEGPDLADWVCLAVGYCVVAANLAVGLWAVLTWKIMFSGRWRRGLHQYGSLGGLIQAGMTNVWEQFISYTSYAALAAKVTLILTLELVVLPAAHGFFLDVCLLPLVGGTVRGRLNLFAVSPVIWVLGHWVLGMCFLMSVGSLLSLSRRLLRPGALPWLHDPYEGEHEQMRLLFQLPVTAHLEREVAAFGVMAALAVGVVYVPVCLATMFPGLLPLRFNILYASHVRLSQMHDLIVFHILLPLTLPHIHPRQGFRNAYASWLRWASSLVGLEDYLLPPLPGRVAPANAAPPPPPAPVAPNPLPAAALPPPVPRGVAPVLFGPGAAAPVPQREDAHDPWDFHARVGGPPPPGNPGGGVAGGGPPPPGNANARGAGPVDAALVALAGVPQIPAVGAPHQATDAGQEGEHVDEAQLMVRLGGLLVLLLGTVIALHTAVLIFPVLIGRGAIRLSQLLLDNDLYAVGIGSYCLWAVCAAAFHIRRLARGTNLQAFAQALLTWIGNLAKLAVLGAITFVILPCLVGHFVTRLYSPFMPVSKEDMSIGSILCSNWAMGVFLMRLSYHALVGGALAPGEQDRVIPPLLPNNPFGQRILALQEQGWVNVPFLAAFRECLLPILAALGLVLGFPVLLTETFRAGGAPDQMTEFMEEYVFLAEVVGILLFGIGWAVHGAIRRLCVSLHEERYLVGRQLANLSDAE